MADDGFSIGPASPDDIAAIRAIEGDARYERLVGHWSEERHREEMALPGSRYFVLRDGEGAITGFALVQGFGDSDLKVHLKRIAVSEPGLGFGSRLLRGVLDWIYANSEVNRIDLDLFVGNERARRAYEKAGFRLEGVLRDYHRHEDGFADMWLMSLLRRDREAQPPNKLPAENS